MTGLRCVVFGASGGIGAALVRALGTRDDVAEVWAGSRVAAGDAGKVRGFAFDLGDEASIAAACASIGGPVDVAIVATGRLTLSDGSGPEKSYRALDAIRLAESFAINAIGPALVAKYVLPLLPKDRRAVFAALSARVGSISDNRLGGWHGYRASKAALNMLVRNFAVELGRTHREAVVVALHPGTVDTGLSAPFQKGVSEDKLFTPAFAAERLLAVLDGLGPQDSGKLFAWDGAEVAF